MSLDPQLASQNVDSTQVEVSIGKVEQFGTIVYSLTSA